MDNHKNIKSNSRNKNNPLTVILIVSLIANLSMAGIIGSQAISKIELSSLNKLNEERKEKIKKYDQKLNEYDIKQRKLGESIDEVKRLFKEANQIKEKTQKEREEFLKQKAQCSN